MYTTGHTVSRQVSPGTLELLYLFQQEKGWLNDPFHNIGDIDSGGDFPRKQISAIRLCFGDVRMAYHSLSGKIKKSEMAPGLLNLNMYIGDSTASRSALVSRCRK